MPHKVRSWKNYLKQIEKLKSLACWVNHLMYLSHSWRHLSTMIIHSDNPMNHPEKLKSTIDFSELKDTIRWYSDKARDNSRLHLLQSWWDSVMITSSSWKSIFHPLVLINMGEGVVFNMANRLLLIKIT